MYQHLYMEVPHGHMWWLKTQHRDGMVNNCPHDTRSKTSTSAHAHQFEKYNSYSSPDVPYMIQIIKTIIWQTMWRVTQILIAAKRETRLMTSNGGLLVNLFAPTLPHSDHIMISFSNDISGKQCTEILTAKMHPRSQSAISCVLFVMLVRNLTYRAIFP